MKGFNITFTAFLFTALQFTANGQNPDGQLRIKIDANVEGEEVKIDTNVNSLQDFDIDAFLKDLGIENELNQLNIDINTQSRLGFDEETFEDMIIELRNIEMPSFEMQELKGLNLMTPNKAVLGVYTEKTPEGAKITGLVATGAAEGAGLVEGDVIVGIDHRTIESPANLSEVIGMYEPGASVKVTYLRERKSQSTQIVLKENNAELNNWIEQLDMSGLDSLNVKMNNLDLENLFEMNMPSRGYLGVYLDDEDDKVLVTGVEENGPAAKAGLKEGDIIKEVNGNKVGDYDELMEFMNGTVPGDIIQITYERNGKIEKTDATLIEVKNRSFYFNNKEESFAPNIIFDQAEPLAPCNTYSYNSTDGKRNVTISIAAINSDEAPKVNSNTALNELHPLMDTRNLTVFSNPTDGTFNIKFTLPQEGDTQIAVTDINGAVVYTETIINFSGTYNKSVSLEGEPKGTYFVKVSQNGYSGTKTVILQ